MRLKELRLQKGFTQRQIADYIGCLPSVYSRYENGDREPSIEVLILLSRFLGVTIDYLVGNEVADSSNELTSYEISLINAAREADDRAREDALNMLLSHKVSRKKENPA
ncbi:MAG: helix-turn-helix transcriptional regulator [Oscillospiraceae bacterium]|nr:helix-turn-helix transcriptional regulator [Oscillospiraceae bacterium]